MTPTRREFLQGAAAAGLAPLLPRLPVPQPGPFHFIFFSDTHVGLKSNHAENAAMVAEIAAARPDFTINGGDVTDYGWAEEYAHYRRLHEPLRRAGIRQYFIPGNHDVRWSPRGPMAFTEGTGAPMHSAFTHQGVRFLLLDSTIPLSHYGHFEAEMLRWVERELAALPKTMPVLLFTHHWIGRDGIMVDDEERLLELLAARPAAHVFTGHGHSDLLWTWNGVPCSMNKGLYQGSWMRVEIDPSASEIRILRRAGKAAAGAAEPNLVWRGPLVPQSIQAELSDAAEFRVDNGKWHRIAEYKADHLSAVPGPHRVSFRNGERYATQMAGPSLVTVVPHVELDGGDRWVLNELILSSDPNYRAPAPPPSLSVVATGSLSGGVMSHLRLEGDDLFLSQMDGRVVRLDANTLRPQWTTATGGYCHSSPLVTEALVIVGSADGELHAFDRATGKPVWRNRTYGPVYASATRAKGIVICASGDGTVFGVDEKTGKHRWTFKLTPLNTGFVQSPLATDGERVFFGAWDGGVYALDVATGHQIWRKDSLDGKSFAYSAAIGAPLVARDLLVIPANGNILWAFDRKTGDVRWRTTSPGDKFGYSSPVFAEGRIIVGCLGDKGEFRCLDIEDGRILWTCATGSDIYDSGPAVGIDWVAVTSVSGLLTVADLYEGTILHQRQLPAGHCLSTPAAREDDLWLATFANEAMKFHVQN